MLLQYSLQVSSVSKSSIHEGSIHCTQQFVAKTENSIFNNFVY